MHEYDSSFVFMPLSAAQSFFTLPAAVTGIELYSSSPLHIKRVSAAVKARLGQSYRLVDWQEKNRTFIDALQVERNVMLLILTLIILVAAFNIVSSMIMLVRSKNADIAVLRSMGASSAAIMRIFLMTGASIGGIGTLFGTALGLLVCWNIDAIKQFIERIADTTLFPAEIYYLAKLPAVVDFSEVLSVVAMALMLSFLLAYTRHGGQLAFLRLRCCAMSEQKHILKLEMISHGYVQAGRQIDVLSEASLMLHPGRITALLGHQGQGRQHC